MFTISKMGGVASDMWEGIKDAGEWVGDAVVDIGEGIGDAAEWTFDNVPGMEELADVGGVFGDIVLAPVKLGGAVMDEVAKLPGMDWADDAFDIAEDVLEEVNSNLSPLHMAAYAARDAKTLKDALRTKRQVDSQNRAIDNMNAAKDAEEKAKYIRHLLRGKGQSSQGVGAKIKPKGASMMLPRQGVASNAARQGVASKGQASQGVAG